MVFRVRNFIVYGFAENIFPSPKKEMPQPQEWSLEENILPKERSKIITEKEKSINSGLFKEYFKY